MAFSMYQASVPLFVRYLNGMSRVLDKAAPFVEARKIDPAVLAGLRLYPDMLPFARQIQIATDNAKGCTARLAEVDIPKYEDTETTLPEFKARIAKTLAFVQGIKPAQIEGSEDRTIVLPVGPNKVEFKGPEYLTTFAIPNFLFHVVTAYDILRHIGVEIGKRDYMDR